MFSDIDVMLSDCRDKDTLKELNGIKDGGSVLTEPLSFLFNDSVESILLEMKYYSSKKEFYDILKKEFIDYGDLPKITAFLTHLFISFNKRLRIRKKVDKKNFMYLNLLCSKIINVVLEDGTSPNMLDIVYKENIG